MNKKQERLAALEHQVERVQRRMNQLDRKGKSLWQKNLINLFVSTAITIAALGIAHWFGTIVTFVAVGLFIYIGYQHQRVNESYLKYKTLLQIKETQVARIRLDWENLPAVQVNDTKGDHPFDIDLDLTEERSLHQLLNIGVSVEGRRRLRDWLLNTTPDLDIIRERQVMVQELTPLTLFRDKLMLYGTFATRFTANSLEGQDLLDWLNSQSEKQISRSTLIIPTVLSAGTVVLAILSVAIHTPLVFCGIPILFSLGWYLATRNKRGTMNADASYLGRSFEQLRLIFSFLEKYPYRRNSQLSRLCEPFFSNPDNQPSVLLRQISRLTNASIVENAELFALIVNAIIPWDIYVAYLLSRYKTRVATLLPRWLEAWSELEALCSLANFAYLNPEYVMPIFATNKQQKHQVLFQATGIGHPLIEPEKKVVNDITLDHMGELLLITGSNMAGKSTFLRTIGINLCLAYAGSAVNAALLQTSLFEIFACIKVTDSTIDGYSYFYAEVRRLKALLKKLEGGSRYPVFLFIDEIFKGTNNQERLTGSVAYIHALLDKQCVGVISTHDLELASLADTQPNIRNLHFREEVIDGRMTFDYKLHQGPCATTNALKILELEGLPTTY